MKKLIRPHSPVTIIFKKRKRLSAMQTSGYWYGKTYMIQVLEYTDFDYCKGTNRKLIVKFLKVYKSSHVFLS